MLERNLKMMQDIKCLINVAYQLSLKRAIMVVKFFFLRKINIKKYFKRKPTHKSIILKLKEGIFKKKKSAK